MSIAKFSYPELRVNTGATWRFGTASGAAKDAASFVVRSAATRIFFACPDTGIVAANT